MQRRGSTPDASHLCTLVQGKAVCVASQQGHHKLVDMLIANDVDVNATDASGMKACDLAVNYPAIQRALLLSGRLDAATKVTVTGVCLALCIGLSGTYAQCIGLSGPSTYAL